MRDFAFPRCSWGHPEHHARCWLAPGHVGKHLILRPHERPAVKSVMRIVVARVDLLARGSEVRAAFLFRVTTEPLGMSADLDAFLRSGEAIELLRRDPWAAIDAFERHMASNQN